MKRNRILVILLSIMLICCTFFAIGCDGTGEKISIDKETGLAFKLNETKDAYILAGIGDCTDTEIVIPSVYKNLPVTSIGSRAFEYCNSLTSIEIANSVTSIGNCAFYGCDSLTSIEIPNSVTNIGEYVFSSCDSLSHNIKNGLKYLGNSSNLYLYLNGTLNVDMISTIIDSNCRFICSSAFEDCDSLTSIKIPNSVTSIGERAFSRCDSLTSIKIPNSVTSIGEYVFSSCDSLTSIKIPNSVTSIGGGAFDGCSSLASIEIPNSVTSIGDYAFDGCSSLTSIAVDANNANYKDIDGNLYSKDGKTLLRYAIGKTTTSFTIPDNVTSIGKSAFSGCDSLTSIEISNSVTNIGDDAFSGCDSLTSIEIPNSVTSIGVYAFYSCDSLTSIEIPNSVTSIGNSAFYYCDSLTIYCEAESKLSGWHSDWNYDNRPVVWGYNN